MTRFRDDPASVLVTIVVVSTIVLMVAAAVFFTVTSTSDAQGHSLTSPPVTVSA